MRARAQLERVWLGFGAGLLVAVGACAPSPVFTCTSSEQCGREGRCEASGFCSFPDEACESGRRYGELSGELGNVCVPADDVVGTGSGTGSSHESSSAESFTSSPSTSEDPSDGGSTGAATNTTFDVTSTTSEPGESGTDTTASTGEPIGRVLDGLIVFYPLDEGAGDVAHDESGLVPAMDLDLLGDGFTWTPTGLHTEGLGIALAQASAARIREACQQTNELTLEAWITPDVAVLDLWTQPGRIITFSSSTLDRNFTLGQGPSWSFGMQTGEGYNARLRTSDPGTENGEPGLQVEITVPLQPQHIVFTRQANGMETLYRDAQPIGTLDLKPGDFSTWSTFSDYHIALGNEIDELRPWMGELHLVAIYDRALTAAEVAQNYEAAYGSR